MPCDKRYALAGAICCLAATHFALKHKSPHKLLWGDFFMKEKTKIFIAAIILPLAVGGLAALITKNSYDFYKEVAQPPFAPPSIAFPIVWTILYAVMGVASGLVYTTPSPHRFSAIKLYLFQLALNFFWPIIFFNLEALWLAFVWIVALLLAVAATTYKFYKVNKTAGLLMLPYLIWTAFATILNLSIAILN